MHLHHPSKNTGHLPRHEDAALYNSSRRGYCAWTGLFPCAQAVQCPERVEQIQAIFAYSYALHGSPKNSEALRQQGKRIMPVKKYRYCHEFLVSMLLTQIHVETPVSKTLPIENISISTADVFK
ncbi:hypothetical protein [Sulfobacillus thermosulfidooxidans]|uniref:hypothetical protein n=1 Tax=Sulfobacillus thermosulfidooxidans TaxID=28034 RepID=UPI00048E96D6|nr:hypothetical protein [Sulfobacillus thermosulfidooxidans]